MTGTRTVSSPIERARTMAALRTLAGTPRRVVGAPVTVRPDLGDRPRVDPVAAAISVLYDEARVLPHPADRLGQVLFAADDLGGLLRLSAILDRLSDGAVASSAERIVTDPDWDMVRSAARESLAAMMLANEHDPH